MACSSVCVPVLLDGTGGESENAFALLKVASSLSCRCDARIHFGNFDHQRALRLCSGCDPRSNCNHCDSQWSGRCFFHRARLKSASCPQQGQVCAVSKDTSSDVSLCDFGNFASCVHHQLCAWFVERLLLGCVLTDGLVSAFGSLIGVAFPGFVAWYFFFFVFGALANAVIAFTLSPFVLREGSNSSAIGVESAIME